MSYDIEVEFLKLVSTGCLRICVKNREYEPHNVQGSYTNGTTFATPLRVSTTACLIFPFYIGKGQKFQFYQYQYRQFSNNRNKKSVKLVSFLRKSEPRSVDFKARFKFCFKFDRKLE